MAPCPCPLFSQEQAMLRPLVTSENVPAISRVAQHERQVESAQQTFAA
jgi:hypothetical protein